MKILFVAVVIALLCGCGQNAEIAKLKRETDRANQVASAATNDLMFATLRAEIAESQCRSLSNSVYALSNKCYQIEPQIEEYKNTITDLQSTVDRLTAYSDELAKQLGDSRYRLAGLNAWNDTVRQTMAAQERSHQQELQQAKIDEENRRVQAAEAARQQALQIQQMNAQAAFMSAKAQLMNAQNPYNGAIIQQQTVVNGR
jgi:chromosome segregation ATPase